METKPEGKVTYRVQRGDDGKWAVKESGFEKPIAFFENEPDATVYAKDLAKTKRDAEVEVAGGSS